MNPTAERVANVLHITQNAPAGAEMSDRQRPANNQPRSRGLGTRQLEWCREHLHGFAVMEQQVIASNARRDEMRKAAGL